MARIMEYVCGRREAITPRPNETTKEYMNRTGCPRSERTGQWKELSVDEARVV